MARDSLELASLASSSQLNDQTADDVSSRPSIGSSRRLSLIEEDPLHPSDYESGRGRMNRSYSVSSAFDFAANMFPLSSTAAGGGSGYAPLGAPTANGGVESLEKHKTLTYLNGLSLIIGLVIGSGIFSSPSQVGSQVGSPGAALVVWVFAGILVWTGASSYAELGGAIPLNGGSQVYLAKTFGELTGFLFTWVAVLVLKPGSAAIIAIIMGEYFARAFIGADAETMNPWVSKGVALVGLVLVTSLNCVSTKMGTRANDMLMFLKFFALLGVAVIGIIVAATGISYKGDAHDDWKKTGWFDNTSSDLSHWAVALYGGLWAYDGWDNTNYVVGEFRNPQRDLPRVINTAMPLVIIFYVLANVAYFLVLPLDKVNSSNTVAVAFGSQVFGPVGALIFALIVSASCFGALNSSTFTSSRLIYVAGKESYFPEIFGTLGVGNADRQSLNTQHTRSWATKKLSALVGDGDAGLFYTPIYALLLNGVLTALYCIVGEFSTLVTFYGVAGYIFYFLTVLGVIVLRYKEPNLERPYKTWITTPIIFCCVSLFLLSKAVFAEPIQTLIVLAFIVVGIPVYYWRVKGRDRPLKREDAGDGQPWWKFWK
ncbi:amino acid permease-domain-containing protein [Emericellopsis atlantica]|uniref:Amino acid permease-domain-containing protein n=1 Tax=Emericellopsis atlantica TaxID=2614577 RepID=A0A9P8CLB8_9HYPO|nr:amino acid permease-domain-containing protein [Emericellopsis atlantica]KAG9250932.1 amino acid permease-domain-containing protein [Emericellopsis atlantica]